MSDVTELHERQSPTKQMHLQIELDHNPFVSLAMQQNAIPTVRRMRIQNLGAEPVVDLTVRLGIEGLSLPWQERLERLEPEGHQAWTVVDLRLSPDSLVAVQESVTTTLTVEVTSPERETARRDFPIEVLAYNQWSGLRGLPELLAAFVLPNHPGVQTLLAQTSALLGKLTGDSALSGYQKQQRQRVAVTAAAIYQVIQSAGIGYVGVPASFEKSGQKVRTPDQITEGRLANCLDISCLFAACLEQSGLHPLLVLVEEHAFVGVWLEEDSCAVVLTIAQAWLVELAILTCCRVPLVAELAFTATLVAL